MGKLHTKNEGPKSGDEKAISLSTFFETGGRSLWLIYVLFSKGSKSRYKKSISHFGNR